MVKKCFVKFWILIILLVLSSDSAHAVAKIRFNLGGAKFPKVSGELSVSITVDCITPIVAVGTAADQLFRDDAVGASYFGYYLSTGLLTSGQAAGTTSHIQIQKAPAETAGRSYYLLGNGTSVPNDQTDLTIAPAAATTIATDVVNGTGCGPNYAANGVSGVNGVTCTAGTNVANMDVTQFVKVLWSDAPATTITSAIQFIVVVN
jgi:hypothetical protein